MTEDEAPATAFVFFAVFFTTTSFFFDLEWKVSSWKSVVTPLVLLLGADKGDVCFCFFTDFAALTVLVDGIALDWLVVVVE